MVLRVLAVAVVVTQGLSAGIHLFGVAGLNPALRALDAATYLAVKQSADRTFPLLMRPLTLAGLVLAAAEVPAAALDGSWATTAPAAVTLAAAVVGLVAVLRGDLPINARMATWDPQAPPVDWAEQRQRWEAWFRLRTWAAVTALAAAVAALASLA